MEVLIIIGKVIFLFISVWWSIVNILRATAKTNIPPLNIIIQSIGITGFITLQWLI